MEKELKELRVKVLPEITLKNGTKFTPYKAVSESGLLVDLRFRLGVDTSGLKGMKKARIVVEDFSDASERYEYPRYYAGNIVSVDKIQ